MHDADKDAALIALTAIRDGRIDFYRVHRRLATREPEGLPVTAWARVIEIDGERLVLFEFSFEADAPRSPLDEYLRSTAPVMVFGIVDASWTITAMSSDVSKVLDLAPSEMIGRLLLTEVDQADVQQLLDADLMVDQEYSVARGIRLRDGAGAWRSLCCVLTSLAATTGRGFILVPIETDPERDEANRASDLERHLLRIAAEVNASGVLQQVGVAPDLTRVPEIADLSTRQWEVLTRLMRGERTATIASEMFISPSTVRNHLAAIFERFGVHSQAELLSVLSHR
jgi:DNA-binding CsgD family transcriptional regulator